MHPGNEQATPIHTLSRMYGYPLLGLDTLPELLLLLFELPDDEVEGV
jgi:hypothetical protein